jgi:hypothetical protein
MAKTKIEITAEDVNTIKTFYYIALNSGKYPADHPSLIKMRELGNKMSNALNEQIINKMARQPQAKATNFKRTIDILVESDISPSQLDWIIFADMHQILCLLEDNDLTLKHLQNILEIVDDNSDDQDLPEKVLEALEELIKIKKTK